MTKRRGHGEGSIRRRANGRWEAALRLSGGKRIYKTCSTRREAQTWLNEAIRRHRNSLPTATERMTLAEYLDRWLDAARAGIRPATYTSYEYLVRIHIKPALGHVPLLKLHPLAIQQLCADKLASGLSPRTVRYIHGVLHRALARAVKWGLLAANPAHAVEAPRVPRLEMKVWTPEEARRFLTAARSHRLFALYVLALTTGMRRGELLGLHWQDIDWQGKRLAICHTLQELGKQGVILAEPKSGKGRRSIAIPAVALLALAEHRQRQGMERAAAAANGAPWPESDLVFLSENGTPLRKGNTNRTFALLVQKANVPRIRFHDLRHTAATLMLSQGVHPKIVQEMLGHSAVSLTLDTYSHVLPTLQEQAAEAMSRLLGPAANLPPSDL